MKKTDLPISLEFNFENSVKQVWSAITKLDEMVAWYFDNIPDFKPEVGFKTSFLVQSETRKFTHNWEITEVVNLKKLVYNWQYPEYEGDLDVVFELVETPEGTQLKLAVIIKEDFPDEIPEFRRDSCIGGWNYFLDGRLRLYLEKQHN